MTELAEKNEAALFRFLQDMSGQLGDDRVRFLPVPSAETVLSGYLPDGAPPSAENEVFKRYHRRAESLKEKEALVPLKEELKKAQKEGAGELYYRTDHHWTMDGAFVGYTVWADTMGIAPKQKAEFTKKKLKEDFYGTVAARVNTEVHPDTLLAFVPEFPVRYQVEYQDVEALSDSLYVPEMLNGPEPYAVYLKGNQAFTRIRTEGSEDVMQKRKLLVVKDSFGNSLVPFLVNHYSETLVVDLRYYKPSLAELIEEEGVTDICVVMNPAQMSKETALYKINR